jgi:hypothetical protein
MSGEFNGRVVTGITAQEDGSAPLTLEKKLLADIERIRELQPKDSWRVCRQFAPDRITLVREAGETFYFVHPGLFPRVAAAYFEQQTPEQRRNPLLGLNAVNLDPEPGESPTTAAWRVAERRRCLSAFARAMLKLITPGGPDGKDS